MIPDWIPLDAWTAYLEMRKGMGKKYVATEYAQKLLIAKLEKWKKEGHDITEIIHQSIENSWQGLFPVKQMRQEEKVARPKFTTMPTLFVGDREVAKASLQAALDVCRSKTRH